MFTHLLGWRPALALLMFTLTACGGGSSSGSAPTGSGATQLSATATSASTVHLAWAGNDAADTRYALERRSADGQRFDTVAEVAAADGMYVDRGLAAAQAYRYRLRRIGSADAPLAESEATTGSEAPLVPTAGATLGAPTPIAVTAAAATLSLDGGRVQIGIPAGAFSDAGAGEWQALGHTNTAVRGQGMSLTLPARPRLPLTLTMRYEAAESDNADALRLAAVQDDGSWMLLPLLARDPAAQTVSAVLPPALMPAPVATGATAGATPVARTLADAPPPDVSVGPTVIRFYRLVAVQIRPPEAKLAVMDSVRLAVWASYQSDSASVCRDELGICTPRPITTTTELPLLNQKPGYARRWLVDAVEGGNGTLGTVAPGTTMGAVYTAPGVRPTPNVVMVWFESVHPASGRVLRLGSRITIVDDVWVGPMTFDVSVDGNGDYYTAATRWVLDTVSSTPLRRVYRAQGTIEVRTVNPCGITASPSTQPLGPALGFSELVVDHSQSPPTYRLQLYTRWDVTVHFHCAGISSPGGRGTLWDETDTVRNGHIQGGALAYPATTKSWDLVRAE